MKKGSESQGVFEISSLYFYLDSSELTNPVLGSSPKGRTAMHFAWKSLYVNQFSLVL